MYPKESDNDGLMREYSCYLKWTCITIRCSIDLPFHTMKNLHSSSMELLGGNLCACFFHAIESWCAVIIINLVVRRLNAYVGKERIHCFSVVRPVAMTQMRLSWWSGATEIQNNSSLLVIKRTRRVILDFGLETQGFERVWAQTGRCEVCKHRRQLQSS